MWNLTTCEIYKKFYIPDNQRHNNALYNCIRYLDNYETYMQNIKYTQGDNTIHIDCDTNSIPGVDIVFCYHYETRNNINVQSYMSKLLQLNGFVSGIVIDESVKNISFLKEFNHRLNLKADHSKLNAAPETRDNKALAENLCAYQVFNKSTNSISKYLDLHMKVYDQLTALFEKTLKDLRVKVVIAFNPKNIIEGALIEAAKKSKIKTVHYLHGFPQFSQAPLFLDVTTAYSKKHIRYLESLGANPSNTRQLGWFEYKTFTQKDYANIPKEKSNNLLFLGQFVGWDRHRLYDLLTVATKAIQMIYDFGTYEITLRLHPKDKENDIVKSFLDKLEGKIKISDGTTTSIIDDVGAAEYILSVSSTALMYGVLLNKKVLEIRNDKINTVWRDTSMPDNWTFFYEDTTDCSRKLDSSLKALNRIDPETFFCNFSKEDDALLNLIGDLCE